MVSVHFHKNYLSKSFIAHMTPLHFRFTKLKVMVIKVTFKNVNMDFVNYLENYLSQSFHSSHADLSWWRHNPIDIVLIMSKTEGSLLWKWFPLVILSLSQTFYISQYCLLITILLIDHGEGLIPIDVVYFRVKVNVTTVNCVKKCMYPYCFYLVYYVKGKCHEVHFCSNM